LITPRTAASVGGPQGFVVVLFQLLLHSVFDLVGILQVHGHHSEGVADEVDGEMILTDSWEAIEKGGFVRVLDVALESNDSLGLHRLGQKEQQRQEVLVV